MNRKIVLQNLDVFTDWLSRGTAWKKCSKVGIWKQIVSSYNWSTEQCDDLYFAKDDKYSEFRKAQIDGKKILTLENNEWISVEGEFSLPVEKYKIKKEKNNLHIGDWAIEPFFSKKPFEVKKSHMRDWDRYGSGSVQIWVPKNKELCWYVNGTKIIFVKIVKTDEKMFQARDTFFNELHEDSLNKLKPLSWKVEG